MVVSPELGCSDFGYQMSRGSDFSKFVLDLREIETLVAAGGGVKKVCFVFFFFVFFLCFFFGRVLFSHNVQQTSSVGS
jgi:hypothetical protein